ncbi:Uncharacterized protein ALO82_01503 [Pseudomonas syringae pv. broussonetiae]|uniref:Integral membrane protein n=1 Tax=Pseudomonas savastanoi TaxID=29438 RepID=A0A3M5JQD8_PSESS|nr:Uncharacterized protein ALO82_01503 [Pseudomonas syringae pv. broussonetiae]RMS17683.1 hypothetical protein ALP70_03178 [Pseudomonas savastanoi]RMT25403.1 hypothetical protein ALP51_02841 [Pseudomonas savastanoi]
MVILSTSTAGTTMSDFMDRTLGLGYATGSAILITLLMVIFYAWYVSEKSLSVNRVSTLKGELFYWFAILISNTLGTALGDYLADDSGLGFAGGGGSADRFCDSVGRRPAFHYQTVLDHAFLDSLCVDEAIRGNAG